MNRSRFNLHCIVFISGKQAINPLHINHASSTGVNYQPKKWKPGNVSSAHEKKTEDDSAYKPESWTPKWKLLMRLLVIYR